MKYLLSVTVLSLLFLFGSFKGKNIVRTKRILTDSIHFPGETHFANVRQLTFGGDNAEAYFSKDGKYLIFQKTDPKNDIMCYQIWMGKVPTKISEKFEPKLISTGTGRTTCPFFILMGNLCYMHLLIYQEMNVRLCRTEQNMATNTFGQFTKAWIFFRQT